MISAAAVADRLVGVRERIVAAGGDPASIQIVAMTKAFDAATAQAVLDAGIVDLGENYAQELLAKVAEIDEPTARWHFVGRLQSNKVRILAPHIALWQSIDRRSLVREVAKRAPGASILIQVNATAEEQKGGCPPAEVEALVDSARELGLEVRGLMAVGPTDTTQDPRPIFQQVRELAGSLDLADCSMGMTHDLEAAVAEGSTMVRIGQALFGPRPPRDEVTH